MSKKIKIIEIIENIILGFIKFYIIAISMLAANIDDYLIPPTFIEKAFIIGIGLGISLLLDIIVNYVIYKILRKRENIAFKNLLKISIIITLINFTFILFS